MGTAQDTREGSEVLIETLWNVKVLHLDLQTGLGACFNRNIVECKADVCFYVRLKAVVLIETLWNVKDDSTDFVKRRTFVLIETLWNVKGGKSFSSTCTGSVLIETLWNVKFNAYTSYTSEFVLIETLWNVKRYGKKSKTVPTVCFNRNIVECKVQFPPGSVRQRFQF